MSIVTNIFLYILVFLSTSTLLIGVAFLHISFVLYSVNVVVRINANREAKTLLLHTVP